MQLAAATCAHVLATRTTLTELLTLMQTYCPAFSAIKHGCSASALGSSNLHTRGLSLLDTDTETQTRAHAQTAGRPATSIKHSSALHHDALNSATRVRS
jgi:hypothetical protein